MTVMISCTIKLLSVTLNLSYDWAEPGCSRTVVIRVLITKMY